MTVPPKLTWIVRSILVLMLAVLVYQRSQRKAASEGIALALVRAGCPTDCSDGACDSHAVVLHFSPAGSPMLGQQDLQPRAVRPALSDIFQFWQRKRLYVLFPSDMSVEDATEYLDTALAAMGSGEIVLITPRGAYSSCAPPLPVDWLGVIEKP